jgi:hypothetical protein
MLIMLGVGSLAMHAQAYYGSIGGNVTDSTGAAVVGAKITATNASTNVSFSGTSSGTGSYTLAQLPLGVYVVHISAPHFKESTTTGVEVHVSTDTSVNAVLQPGAVTENVTVQADAVQVETTSAAVGEVVSGTQVRELPLSGENFVGLTQLSPGVSAAQGANFVGKGLDGGVNFSVDGNPYNMNLFLVDGVNNNDVGSGRTILVYPSVDTIAEFKMIRNSYGPEYGQAAGAIISITTKTGQNQFHGGAFYAGRNDALDANNWFSNNAGLPRGEERRDDYGYNISGPVMRNKAFFWFNQEWNKEIQGVPLASCVPTAAEESGDFSGYGAATTDQCGANIPTIPAYAQAAGNPLKIANPDPAGLAIAQFYPTGPTTTNGGNNYAVTIPNHLNWMEWNVRGDYDVTKSNRASFRWTTEHWNNPGQNDASVFWGSPGFPTINSNWNQPSRSVMAKLSSTITPSMVNDVEFGFGENRIITTIGGTNASAATALQTAFPTTFPSSIKQVGEFAGSWGGMVPYGSIGGSAYNYSSNTSMWNIAPYGNHEDLYTVQDNLSKVHGNHLIKAGVFLSFNNKIEDSGDGADRPGNPEFNGNGNGCLTAAPTGGGPYCFSTGNPLATDMLPGTASGTPGTAGYVPAQFFSNISEGSIDGIAAVNWRDVEPYVGDTWKMNRKLTVAYGFRWSLYREPYGGTTGGGNNAAFQNASNFPSQWANWQLSAWSASEATANPQDACNGILTVPGTTPCANQVKYLAGLGINLPLSSGTPGPNASLVQQNNHSIAPRLGITYDVFGNGKTAIRIGAGQFFQREEVGLAEGMAHNPPFQLTISSNRSMDAPSPVGGASVSPSYGKTTDGKLANSWQYNVSIEQEVAHNTTLQIGYVGNAGLHLTDSRDGNAIPNNNWMAGAFQAGSQNPLRPAFNFGTIGSFKRGGQANYNSLQALFKAQTGAFSTFQAAYTWSHSLGNVAEDDSSGGITSQATTDQYDARLDKGNTNINRPNIFVANEVFYLPKLERQNAFVKNVAGGWEANSIFIMAEGSSFTVESNGVSGAGGSTLNSLVGTGYVANQRALATGVSCAAGTGGRNRLNYNAFTFVGYALGTFPSNLVSRGICTGSPNTNVDGQLAKNWTVGEKLRIKFSMDFFDLFNHPNFNSANLEGSTYGAGGGPAPGSLLGPNGLYCGGATQPVGSPFSGSPCSPTNNIVTAAFGTPTPGSFGQASAENNNAGRSLQYTLKLSF